ncbi:YaaR family protein [Tenuibacillus multivorans]|uniref:DUF327 family protein n=1 Tax=Tenuibacillus multivorans TaxID=237069 RepID=A0A1G9W2G2_9BACI|nr:YaaR family protein [Tenuibacillus multivorans]GEL78279.1 hypothetical protein TMU01_25140 [Tenuibacillus multivorans]SDM78381.1 hypothetical protein SAMN05216498_0571 [Tenuibacillus multivorans]
MKISQELRSQVETAKSNTTKNNTTTTSFQQAVSHEKQKMHESELNRLLGNLSAQGEKVAKFRSFKDLARYKKMVQQFIEEAVQYGLELEQSRSWSMNGDNRKLMLVKQIDEKLVQLTDDVLDQEKPSLDILDVIGEIKGLLLNLRA